MWSSLREIQRGRAGLRPVRSKVIRKANGELCAGPEESLSRWQEHFSAVLNMTSCFSNGIFDSVKQLPLREDLDLPPSADEVLAALGSLRGNKAGGKNGLLPELWKCCGANLLEHLVELFHQVWQGGCVPQEWKDALIVPIPKKGDLSLCDNWRGISLLDVGGKMFAKIIQQRLQTVVEEVLPDSQCGFRSGRGCVDMIYCARQLVEKAIEHNTKIFMLFIDLRKAYDSIPHQALWCALKKYGIPQSMLKVICSLHDGMRAEVIIDGQVAPEFEVSNGLRQGCVIAPTLFNLYFNLAIEQWRGQCSEFGVDVLYKCGGKLVGERTRRPSQTRISELLFADDAAAVSTTRKGMERAAKALDGVISEWGLTLNIQKTKLLVAGTLGNEQEATRPLKLDGGEIECVTDFKYLGSILESKGGVVKEVGKRIAEASCAFGALRKPVFKDWNLSLRTKRLIYRGVVLGVLLYGSETWATKRDTTRKLEVFHNRCLRGILGVTAAQQKAERISSIQVAKLFGMEESLEDMIIARRLRRLGHIARMDDGRIPKKMLFGWLPQHRPTHGARMRWRDRVRKDLRKFKIRENNWFRVSQERDMWREVCRAGLEHATQTRLGKDEMRRSNAGRGSHSDAVTSLPFQCDTCQRSFRCRQDIARHRCVTTRPRGQVLRPRP